MTNICCDNDYKYAFCHGLGKFRQVGNICTEQFNEFIKLAKYKGCNDSPKEISGISLKIKIECDTTYQIRLSGRLTGNCNQIKCGLFDDKGQKITKISELEPLPISSSFGEACYTFHTPKKCNCCANLVIYLVNYSQECSMCNNICDCSCTSPPNNICINPNSLCAIPTPLPHKRGNHSNAVYLQNFTLKLL